jgi:CBS domain-containing protein
VLSTPSNASVSTGVTVGEVMSRGVVTCSPGDRLANVAANLDRGGISAAVYIANSGAAPAIVTDLELIGAVFERGDEAVNTRVDELMHEPVPTLPPGATLDAAVAIMAKQYTRHVLVTDPDPVGVVSSFDVATVLGGQQPRLARMIRPAPARPAPSAHTFEKTVVHDVMHRGVVICPADTSLATVGRTMADQRTHCVAVSGIERRGQHLIWGVIEDIDLVVAAHRGALSEPAASIAATPPMAVDDSDTLAHAVRLMVEHDTNHVLVAGPAGTPTGIVSTRDALGVLAANE